MRRRTVSLCMIARNEEASIGMAIKSVLALVDEVIVADTGSDDNTQIIAEGYGARVLEIPWEDDFAAARNRTLAEARCDWILVLDADEYLQPMRPVEFQRLLNDPGAAAYEAEVVDPAGADLGGHGNRVRLFRNDQNLRYRHPVFESLDPSLKEYCRRHELEVKPADLVVVNEGQNPDRVLRQRERQQKIMRLMRDARPAEPYFSYLMACQGLSLLDQDVLPAAGMGAALVHLQQAWRRLSDRPAAEVAEIPWFPDLAAKLVSALLVREDLAEACRVRDAALAVLPLHPAVLLQSVAVDLAGLGRGMGPGGDGAQRAGEVTRLLHSLLERAGSGDTAGLDTRILHLYPLRYLGELALLQGRVSEAVGLFEQTLGLDPGYSFGWLGMAECSRFAGDRKRALKLYLRTVTAAEANHRGWLRGWSLMRELDYRDNASSWWARLTRAFPEHPEVIRRNREADLALTPDV
ncbi:MAG: glycosyltransferase [bacterium]